MSILINIAQVAAGVNIILLLVLCYIWGSNYLELRSKHTLGLLIFAVFLLLENALALYVYLIDPELSLWFNTAVPDIAWQAMLALHILEMIGIAFLTWVSID